MGIWQIQIWGEGFVLDGEEASFELDGIVKAANVSGAFDMAVALAKQQYPELSQAEHSPGPGPVINAEEIQELSEAPESQIDKVELFWIPKKSI